jgi:hypothetical protein
MTECSLNKHSVVLGSWDLPVVGMNYGFQNPARAALRASLHRCGTSASKIAKFGGTAYDKAPAFAFDAKVSAFRRS